MTLDEIAAKYGLERRGHFTGVAQSAQGQKNIATYEVPGEDNLRSINGHDNINKIHYFFKVRESDYENARRDIFEYFRE